MTEVQNTENAEQTVVVEEEKKKKNVMGLVGFIIALIALFLGWIPIVGWIIWALGLIFSIVGVFKKPRGLAIAGLIISVISIIMTLVLWSSVAMNM